jgi:hypothetical protein
MIVALSLLMHSRRRRQNFSRRLLFMNAFRCGCASSTALCSIQSTTTITFCASEDCAPCLLRALSNLPLQLKLRHKVVALTFTKESSHARIRLHYPFACLARTLRCGFVLLFPRDGRLEANRDSPQAHRGHPYRAAAGAELADIRYQYLGRAYALMSSERQKQVVRRK